MQKHIEFQLECKHISELAEINLALHCNEFIKSIADYTMNLENIQVNLFYGILWININDSRDLNVYIY